MESIKNSEDINSKDKKLIPSVVTPLKVELSAMTKKKVATKRHTFSSAILFFLYNLGIYNQ